jgi:hypothetical protein
MRLDTAVRIQIVESKGDTIKAAFDFSAASAACHS